MQEMQGQFNSITCITHPGVTCLFVSMPTTKICISGKIGLVVKVQNGGNQGSIAASKSPQYKDMPGNLTFLGVGVCDRGEPLTLKCSKIKARHVKKCNPGNLTFWGCMENLKVLASIFVFKGEGLGRVGPQTPKKYGLKVPPSSNLKP